MNRNSKRFSTQALIAAGALTFTGVSTAPAFGEKPAGYEQADRSVSETHADKDHATYSEDATPTAERRTQANRAENVAKDSPELDFTGYSETQKDWNDQKQSSLDEYVQEDAQKMSGRIVNATSYLTDSNVDSPTSPKAFLSEDNELYLLIQTQTPKRDADQHAWKHDAHDAKHDGKHAAKHDSAVDHEDHTQMDRATHSGEHKQAEAAKSLRDLPSDSRVAVEGRVVERAGMKAILVDSLWTESEMSDSSKPTDDAQSSIK